VVAALNKEKLITRQRVEQAFKIFDIDGNGFIDKEEIEQIMGGTTIDEAAW